MNRTRADFSGLAKERPGWFAPAIAFFVTACLSAVVFAYYFAPGPPGLGEELPDPTDATRPVALAIGSMRFRIPANYVQLASARRGGMLTEVDLAAMLPQLDGYSLASAKDFTGHAPDSPIVNLKIRSGQAPLPESDRLNRIYQFQIEDPQGEPQASGLTRYSFREESGYRGQELFTGPSEIFEAAIDARMSGQWSALAFWLAISGVCYWSLILGLTVLHGANELFVAA